MREFPIVFYIVFSTSGYLLFLLCCILVHLFLQTSAIFSGGIISHTFELEAKSKGVFAGEPAVIKFRVPTKAALQVNICWNCCLFFISGNVINGGMPKFHHVNMPLRAFFHKLLMAVGEKSAMPFCRSSHGSAI